MSYISEVDLGSLGDAAPASADSDLRFAQLKFGAGESDERA
jgi:hypothetical protein